MMPAGGLAAAAPAAAMPAAHQAGEDHTGTPGSFARGTGLSCLRYTDAWHHLYSSSWGQCT